MAESEKFVATLTTQLSEKSVAVDELARELSEANEQKSEISESRNSAKNLLASRVSEIESERDQILIEKGALELGLKNVQQEKTDLQLELSNLISKFSENEKTAEEIQRDLENQVNALKAQKHKLEND